MIALLKCFVIFYWWDSQEKLQRMNSSFQHFHNYCQKKLLSMTFNSLLYLCRQIVIFLFYFCKLNAVKKIACLKQTNYISLYFAVGRPVQLHISLSLRNIFNILPWLTKSFEIHTKSKKACRSTNVSESLKLYFIKKCIISNRDFF